MEEWTSFYTDCYREEVEELLEGKKSIEIDYSDVREYDLHMAMDLESDGDQAAEYAERALKNLDLLDDVGLSDVAVRFEGIPQWGSERTKHGNSIHSMDVDSDSDLITVRGVVEKATGLSVEVEEGVFECQCGNETRLEESTGETDGHQCNECNETGEFKLLPDESRRVLSKRIRLDVPEENPDGKLSENVEVVLQDKLTQKADLADRVTVSGTLRVDTSGDKKALDGFSGSCSG
ncbi:MAG: hypothetical protein SV760_00530, partial [Halobacteria archaeon]|nr:hypothetical protein [Halobacteria archaeon]